MRKYRRSAVASSFSPTHLAVLSEALACAKNLGISLEVFHAAPRTEQSEVQFEKSFRTLGGRLPIRWLGGSEMPAEDIFNGLREYEIDLFIAGARQHEPQALFYPNSISRRFLTESPCDVLLFPQPNVEPRPITSAVYMVEQGDEIAEYGRALAQELKLEEVMLLVSENPFAKAIALARGEKLHDAHEWSKVTAAAIAGEGVETGSRVVSSNTGFSLMEATRAIGPDLMVVWGDYRDGRINLPAHLDWVRQILPTRFLLCSKK